MENNIKYEIKHKSVGEYEIEVINQPMTKPRKVLARYAISVEPNCFSVKHIEGEISRETYLHMRLFARIYTLSSLGTNYFWDWEFNQEI